MTCPICEQPLGLRGCPNCHWEPSPDPREHPALYDLAKEITHDMGATWTDPRTGQKYPPKEKPK
jgi:hypothetical protein